jgi:methylglyoxal synthase
MVHIRNIAIIAHDQKKPTMVEFLKERREWIDTVSLLATGRTAEFIEREGIEIRHMSRGRSGGYREIIEMIRQKEVDMVFFFMDPDVERPFHEDMEELLDICVNQNVPLALNPSSAELLILGMIRLKMHQLRKK